MKPAWTNSTVPQASSSGATSTSSRERTSRRRGRGMTRRNRMMRSRKRIFDKENVSPNQLLLPSTPRQPSASNKPSTTTSASQLFSSQRDVLVSSTPITRKGGDSVGAQQVSFLTTPSRESTNSLLLSNWGLPDKVLAQYSLRGIKSMFQWQADCLLLPGILNGGNLVYSAPTSAGKTLVAELLALKCVLEAKKKVVIILPFVSIAHEKSSYLQAIFEPQGVRVGGFMGSHSPSGGFTAVDIAICTIEKANSLINRLLEERATHNLGAVIVDELHMIGDNHRGYLLELLLTKIMYTGKAWEDSSQHIQIIGMSATLPNIHTLAKWLGAKSYFTDFRPTPLQEMVKVGPTLYDTKFNKLREYDQCESISGDEDDILLICQERILRGHSVLIFCPTKAWCENLALTLAEAQAGFFKCSSGGRGEGSSGAMDHHGLVGVCEQLRRTQVGLDHVLEKTVPNGVAFHHAGLTFEEREIVEGAFRQTLIKVLIATSTLSSGVNLPARLVIVRTPFFQRSLVDVLVYKQMVGRAGRKGIDKLGESILICKPSERAKVVGLFKTTPKQIHSCLCSEAAAKGSSTLGLAVMKRALLEIIASGVARTREEVELYTSCTLYYAELETEKKSPAKGHSNPDSLKTALNSHLDATLTFLLQNDFISSRTKAEVNPSSTTELCPTQLGMATISSSLSPDEALVVFRELGKARRNFVLENELHIIYLVTPVYIQEQWPNIDWYKYLCLWERLSPDMRHVSDTLGVKEAFLARAIQGQIPVRTDSQRETHRVHRRFFTALALHDLVHEVPIRQVARQYNATKGLLQTLQSAAGTFAGMVTVFCNRLGWTNLELLVSQFQSRLMFGVERELCELVRISLLNGFRARVLYNTGYHTLAALATANPNLIETCLRNAIPFKSYKLTGSGGDEHANVVSTCSTWCAKLRKGMTECEAAAAIVNEAKTILSSDLNIPLSVWDRKAQIPLSPTSGNIQPKFLGVHGDVLPKVYRENPSCGHPMEEVGCKKLCTQIDSKLSQGPLSSHQEPSGVNPVSDVCPSTDTAQHSDFIPASALLKVSHKTTKATNTDNSEPPHPIPNNGCQPRGTSGPVLDLSPIGVFPADACVGAATLEKSSEVTKELSFSDSFSKSNSGLFSLENLPMTIPSSLSCSADASMSFSFQTLAMIDAVCDAANSTTAFDGNTRGGLHAKVSFSVSNSHGLDCSFPSENFNSFEQMPPKLSNSIKCVSETPTQFHPTGLKELSSLCSSQLSQSGITLVNVTSNRVLFDTFVSECLEQKIVAFSVAYTSIEQSDGIGSVVVKPKHASGIPLLPLRNEQVVGIAFCWGAMDAYYISLHQDPPRDPELHFKGSLASISLDERIQAIKKLFGCSNSWEKLVAYDMKKHAKLLGLSCGSMPAGRILDPVVANWMLNPDAKEKTIHKMVLQYLPDQPLLSGCEEYEELPLSSLATNNTDPEMQASAESILAYMLTSKLEVLLEAEGLHRSYLQVEMPSLLVLAKVELNGIGFSPDKCANQRDILQKRVSELEQDAYSAAGHTFSLTSPEDVASVLFLELKLPSGTDFGKQRTLGPSTKRVTRKKLQHLSTAKDVLEKIRPLHSLPGIVLEWRRISSTMSKTVYPLFKEAIAHEDLKAFRIHFHIQIHTATGRVSVSDPSLQMVPKEFHIGTPTCSSKNEPLLSESQFLKVRDSTAKENGVAATPPLVCMRDVFQAFPGAVFLTADYSQLELRILAHVSGDAKLRHFLNGKEDVFRMIAGEWLGLAACNVSDKQRQETKQVCYGMIYGIGARALGEQLGITDNEASQFMETFKSKYPTLKKYISNTIQFCRDEGHVTTLLGRKRFLPGIHSTNIHVRSQAERQAVNTTIQGSAADLVKTAMVNIDRKIAARYSHSATCLLPCNAKSIRHAAYLVLQLHDELLYEVLENDLEEVARIVQQEMENALELSVKFPVKMKVGNSWGTLKPYSV